MLDKSSTLYLYTYYHCCRTFQIGFICCSFNELKPKDSELVKKGRHIIPLTSQKVHPIGEWGGREKKAGAREIKNPHFCSSKKWWHPNKNLRMFFPFGFLFFLNQLAIGILNERSFEGHTTCSLKGFHFETFVISFQSLTNIGRFFFKCQFHRANFWL